MPNKVIDLGDCPICHCIMQPTHRNGFRSQVVDGVLFCVFCVEHSQGLEEKVKWAKMIAQQEEGNKNK